MHIVHHVPSEHYPIVIPMLQIFGESLPTVVGLIAFADLLTDKQILEACHDRQSLSGFLATHLNDSSVWNRFIEEVPFIGKATLTVVRLFSLIDKEEPEVNEMFDVKEILKNAELYANLYDRLGDLTVSFMLDGVEAAESALKHIDYFEQVASVLEADTRFTGSSKCRALSYFPHRRIDEEGLKAALLKLITQFGAGSTDCFLAVREAEDAVDAAERCISMDRALKGHSQGIFIAHDEGALDIYQKYFPFFQGMLSRLEKVGRTNLCREVFERYCSSRFIEEYGADLLKLASSTKAAPAIPRLAEQLRPFKRSDFHHSFVTELCDLARNHGSTLDALFDYVLIDVIADNLPLVRKALAADIYHAHQFLSVMPWDEYKANSRPFEQLLDTWKLSAWGILSTYKKSESEHLNDFLNDHGIEMVSIREHSRSASGHLFAFLPAELWESLGVRYAQVFGESAGWMYRRAMRKSKTLADLTPDPEWFIKSNRFLDLYTANKKEYGIIHAERYLKPSTVVHAQMKVKEENALLYLLDENLRCLDPNYKKECKLAVIVMPHFDNNGAFRSIAQSQYKQLRAIGYKVVFCEANSGSQALDLVRRVVERHRAVGAEVSKGAHFVGLYAHANFDFSAWRDPEMLGQEDDGYLDANLEEALRIREILSPDNPIISIGGCLVGQGGVKANNLGRIINQWNRGITVFANEGSLSPKRFVLDDSETKITGLAFNNDEERRISGGDFTRFYY